MSLSYCGNVSFCQLNSLVIESQLQRSGRAGLPCGLPRKSAAWRQYAKQQEEAMARETDDPLHDLSRRDLFKTVGVSAAAAVAGSPLPASNAVAQAQPAAASQLEALETLNAME